MRRYAVFKSKQLSSYRPLRNSRLPSPFCIYLDTMHFHLDVITYQQNLTLAVNLCRKIWFDSNRGDWGFISPTTSRGSPPFWARMFILTATPPLFPDVPDPLTDSSSQPQTGIEPETPWIGSIPLHHTGSSPQAKPSTEGIRNDPEQRKSWVATCEVFLSINLSCFFPYQKEFKAKLANYIEMSLFFE